MRMEYRADKKWSEHEIQAAFFKWVRAYRSQFPLLKLFHAIPNGAYKSRAAAAKFQAEGLEAGVPDTHLPVAQRDYRGDGYNSLYIEFKAPGRYPTPEQKVWIAALRSAGNRVEIFQSWEEAANLTIDYLGLPLKKL